MKIELRKIKFGSGEYKLEVELRSKILREPLGLRFSKEELSKESADVHLGAFVDGHLVGCLLLSPLRENIKMRQVAVDSKMQKTGIGKTLVLFSESVAQEMGFCEIVLHAREAVVPFYQRLGYEVDGKPFEEVTIPHRKMKKTLNRTP